MPYLYRIKLIRWDNDGKEACRAYCLKHNILACGWPAKTECTSLQEYQAQVKNMFHKKDEPKTDDKPYDNQNSWTTAVKAIAEMQPGSLCWTQGKDGKYYLGKICDNNIYFKEPNYPQIGIYRKCQWQAFELDDVPGKVISCLIGGKTLQRIHEPDIARYSENLYNGTKQSKINFFPLLHWDDLEDLLGLYLQKEKGYFVFPSTNKSGTACYEYMLVNKNGKKAIIQCKTGHSKIDDPSSLIRDRQNMDIYITTETDDKITGKNVHFISKEQLKEFAERNPRILPDRIKKFLEYSK